MGKTKQQAKQQAKEQAKNYQKLYEEVTRRAYLGASPCQQCGHYLPWIGYQHMCSIHYKGHYNGPADASAVMKAYISQQMAQLAMQPN